jgi:hypothetical protein
MHTKLLALLLRNTSSTTNPPDRPGFDGITVVTELYLVSYSFHNTLQPLSSAPPGKVGQAKFFSIADDQEFIEDNRRTVAKNVLKIFIDIS